MEWGKGGGRVSCPWIVTSTHPRDHHHGHSTALKASMGGLGDLHHPWIKREAGGGRGTDCVCPWSSIQPSGEPEVKAVSFPGDGVCLGARPVTTR